MLQIRGGRRRAAKGLRKVPPLAHCQPRRSLARHKLLPAQLMVGELALQPVGGLPQFQSFSQHHPRSGVYLQMMHAMPSVESGSPKRYQPTEHTCCRTGSALPSAATSNMQSGTNALYADPTVRNPQRESGLCHALQEADPRARGEIDVASVPSRLNVQALCCVSETRRRNRSGTEQLEKCL